MRKNINMRYSFFIELAMAIKCLYNIRILKLFLMKFLRLFLFAIILSGCGENKNRMIEQKSVPLPAAQVKLAINANFFYTINPAGNISNVAVNNTGESKKMIVELKSNHEIFKQKNNKENLAIWIDKWQLIYNTGIKYDSAFILPWIKSSAELLTLTGNVFYAEEIERILTIYENSGLKQSLINEITPYVFSKYVDNIYINFLYDSNVRYNHSMGGEVKIEQLVSKENGRINLNFKMEEKRYIELYIRIPSWVNNAEVEVKKVYYHAVPGGYCKIAKKWKNGDVVNIYLN